MADAVTAAPPSPRFAAEPPWRPLVAAAALTVGLHLGVLGAWPSGEQLRGAQASTMGATAPTWQVRTVTVNADRPAPAHDRTALGETQGPPPSPTPAPSEASDTAQATRPPAAAQRDLAAPPSLARPMAITPLAADAARPARELGTSPPGEDGDEEYLPRRRLTRPPQAAQVLIPYPEQAPLGRWEVRLTLFIDEQGRVRRVRPAGPLQTDDPDSELPAELLDAAVQTFLATRYTPGELKGRAVKSRIDIAVEFRADAPPRSAGGD